MLLELLLLLIEERILLLLIERSRCLMMMAGEGRLELRGQSIDVDREWRQLLVILLLLLILTHLEGEIRKRSLVERLLSKSIKLTESWMLLEVLLLMAESLLRSKSKSFITLHAIWWATIGSSHRIDI